jgi:predicted ATPase/class 3 adenylate cyclase
MTQERGFHGASAESPSVYVPMDRRLALAQGRSLPDRMHGAALFADISGFTPLTESLARELGPRRGSEELTRHLNQVYDAVIAELHRFGGSVVGFAGDGVSWWFDGDSGLQAVAAGLAMQAAIAPLASVVLPSGRTLGLTLKVAVVAGTARRFVVGDPQYQVIDALAGKTLETLAAVEHHAVGGEVVLDEATCSALGESLRVAGWRQDKDSGQRFAIVAGVAVTVAPCPWPPISEALLDEEMVRPWLLQPVYERLHRGFDEFVAELRSTVTVFLSFTGIDYDADSQAGEKLDAFVRHVQGTLARYDGTLIQLTFGDKGSYLYATFGAPAAHEDDDFRAASAAVELRQIPERLPFIQSIQIGITCGRTRTGAYGATSQRTYGVMGDSVNLAARLMQAASPGQILVGKDSYDIIADAYAWRSLPPYQVKGRAVPIAVYELVAARPHAAASGLQVPMGQPMVGREAELELLMAKARQAAAGSGSVVGVDAEAGAGKTRLAAELQNVLAQQGWLCCQGESSSYGINTSYHSWQNLWWQFFGLDPTWSLARQLKTIETQLASIDEELAPRLPLLGIVLNLPIPDNDLTAGFDSKLRKSSLESLLIDCLRKRSQRAPTLLVLDNSQWMDPLSFGLVEVIARAIEVMRAMLVVVYRPPDLPHLIALKDGTLPGLTRVLLGDLDRRSTERLFVLKVEQVFGRAVPLAPAQMDRIIQRSGSNPFFIEELLNYLKSQGLGERALSDLDHSELPSGLQSLILSRIDQLREGQKTTLKVASIVGRSFDVATLSGYYPQLGRADQITGHLQGLTEADLTLCEEPAPALAYAFRQMLTQEVAYESLPYATRSTLHERLADFIELSAAGRIDQHLDQLAYHYALGQNDAKKREYLLKAARRAQSVYANTAAIEYYTRVLPLLSEAELPDILLDLGRVYELLGHWQDARSSYAQALSLAGRSGDRTTQAWCMTATGELLRKQGQYAEAAAWLDQARAGFEVAANRTGVAQVLHFQGTLLARQGDLDGSEEVYRRSLAIRQELDDQANIASLLSNLAIIARFRKDFETARALNQEALAIREQLGDRWAIGVSLNNLGNLALSQGNYAEATARMEQALGIWRQVGDRWAIANTLTGLGDVAGEKKDDAVSRAYYRESLAINRELDDRLALAYLFEALGCLAAAQGEPERAMQLVGAAAGLRAALGAPLPPTEASRLQDRLSPARALLKENALQAAEEAGRALSLDEAIELASS